MTKTWTEFQQQAIASDGQDICVAAGAGSGKTGVLVERFVRLVVQSKAGALPSEQRAGVDRILVITFTEKATKEMKTRIVAELNRLGLLEERRQVETAYISTIHGFCSRLLQENPFEAGVDPQFRVLDEVQARRLLRQECEAVIAQAYASGDAEITELVASIQSARQPGEATGDPIQALAGAVDSVLAKVRGAGKTRREVEAHWRLGQEATAARSLEPIWSLLTPLLDEIAACIAGLEKLRLGVGGALELARCALLEHAPKLRPRAVPLSDTVQALSAVEQAVRKARPRIHNAPQQEIQLAQLLERVRIACDEAKDYFEIVAAREEESALFCHRFWGLLAAVWKAHDAAKQQRGQLDNDDLQAEGVRLLEEAPGVRARYQRRFRYLMVDEFQDTNPLQMRLLELLHLPRADRSIPLFLPASGKGHPPQTDCPALPGSASSESPDEVRSVRASAKIGAHSDINSHCSVDKSNFLFVVGDVQQSIYGFRHADSTLFRALERRFREERAGLHVPLAANFRSRPEILKLIETVFRQVWREAETPFMPLTPAAAFDARPGPSLEILLSQDLYRRDYVALETEALAARIQQIVEGEELRLTGHLDRRCGEPVAYRDIAVLLRGLGDIEKYERAFARHGVPYYVVGGGRGYYARHEIRDLLNMLIVLDTPLDDVAVAAALRSPFAGVELDTLYRLAQFARHSPDAAASAEPQEKKRGRGGEPLYPCIAPLLESGRLPEGEADKLRRFLTVMESLRAQEDRLPVGHLIERLIARFQYDIRLLVRPGGRRRLANIRKLLQMANSESVMGVRNFIRRLRDVEKISEREGDAPTEEEAADVVRILTIHGAKGLEFPVVALADLSRGLLLPERGLFACEPQLLALGTRLSGAPNMVYKAIEARRRQADREESERLLYVAMTRAREHLILCGNIGRNRNFNWADNLFPLLGLLNAPPEPEIQTLSGDIRAQVAPLSHYVHGSAPGAEGVSSRSRRRDLLAERIAESILAGEPFDSLL